MSSERKMSTLSETLPTTITRRDSEIPPFTTSARQDSIISTDQLLEQEASSRATVVGSVSALLAALTITFASSAVQGLGQRWPDMELNIFRWTFMIIPLGIYFIWTKNLPSIPREKIPYVLFYGFLVSGEQVLFFTGVNFLPLGLMAAVFRTSLVTMAAITTRIIEKEKLSFVRFMAVTLGIIGIIMMWQPEFIFGEKTDDGHGKIETENNKTLSEQGPNALVFVDGDLFSTQIPTNFSNLDPNTSEATAACTLIHSPTEPTAAESKSLIRTDHLSEDARLFTGLAITVSAAFLVVMQGVSMKRKQYADYCVWKLMFWVGVTGIVWTTILSFSLEDVVFIVDAKDLSLVATYAMTASLHMYTFLFALRKASYFIVALIMVTQIVFNLIAQYTIMAHIFPGQHNVIEILGGVSVVIAASLPTAVTLVQSKKRRKEIKRRQSVAFENILRTAISTIEVKG